MQLRQEQLDHHLQSGLKPIYVIGGDEPLLVQEAAQAVRDAAKVQGFTERQVFDVDAKFDWNQLGAEAGAMSLFASRKIIDLRMNSPKPGREGGAALTDYAANTDPDNLLLITSGKLDRNTLKAKWLTSLERAGVVVQIWPLRPHDLPGWLDRRMKSRGLQPEPQACRLLAARVEGNLLAAAQEIDKLLLLKGEGPIVCADIEQLVADNARFDVFRLIDAALDGRVDRAMRMFDSLKTEDAPIQVIAWAITKEVRVMTQLREALDRGANLQPIFRNHGVWDSRKNLVQRAMRRLDTTGWHGVLRQCARLDQISKGQAGGDPWELAASLCTQLATGNAVSARLADAAVDASLA